MAFWGVQLRPGSPYTYRYKPSDGRLRVTQAALVSCDGATRTLVRCTLGNRMPLILCSLNPRLSETCHLDVEFEENVKFSVLGPSSVHLSGYYLRSSTGNTSIARDQQQYESSGEDIGDTDNELSYVSEDDSYESEFIDDNDVEASDKEYVSDSMDDGDACSSRGHRKPAFEKHSRKVELQHLSEKKHQADKSGDNIDEKATLKRNRHSIFYSSCEDEDIIGSEKVEHLRMWSSLSNKSDGKGSQEIKPENVMSNGEIEKESNDARKGKCDAVNHDPAAQTNPRKLH